MKLKEIATSFTASLFVIIGVTGIMLYFHLFEKNVKELHEILGLAFTAFVILHIIGNWKNMKKYFSKKIFFLSVILITSISGTFIVNTLQNKGKNPKKVLIVKLLEAPLIVSLDVLGLTEEQVVERLKNSKLKYDNLDSLKSIAHNNKTSPFKIISIINKED